MSGKFRIFIGVFVMLFSLTALTGCAAAWFLAGAGTAATVAAVANSSDDGETK
ncbi:MAG: hypothetical protein GF408_04490 [Candidatus Omnitrophica bacterium]|nr:hypothetical protein [Candidatus Omnitrophota bacterium]